MAKRKIKIGTIIINIVVIAIALIFFAPFVISVLVAFQTPYETAQNILTIPSEIRFDNFTEAMERAGLGLAFRNSLIVTVTTVLLAILCASTAGYGIGRHYQRKEMRFYELILLASFMLPFQTIMIPVYRMYMNLGLLNTLHGAIFMIAGSHLAFCTMLYIGFVKSLPPELEEAARIEGYGDLRIFISVVFPLLKNITFTVATLVTLWTWNEFNISLIVLQRNAVRTIPIRQFVFFAEFSAQFNLAFAAAVIAMVPVVIFFIAAQGFIVKGLTDGAVKG
jgi:raffinose/stachyose/melibiose transport system permease protein